MWSGRSRIGSGRYFLLVSTGNELLELLGEDSADARELQAAHASKVESGCSKHRKKEKDWLISGLLARCGGYCLVLGSDFGEGLLLGLPSERKKTSLGVDLVGEVLSAKMR